MMLLFCQLVIIVGLFLSRILMVTMPYFSRTIENHFLANFLIGFFSDLSLISLWIMITGLGKILNKGHFKTSLQVFFAMATVLIIVVLASHIHYVEFYGLTLRPYHLKQLAMKDTWLAGPSMVLRSYRALLLAIFPLLAGALLLKPCQQLFFLAENKRILSWLTHRHPFSAITIWLILAVIFNSAVINLRNRPGINPELRYNPFQQYYYNYLAYKQGLDITKPSPEVLISFRNILADPNRVFVPQGAGDIYPFWQKRISTSAPSSSADGEIRDKMRSFLANSAQKKGPWNILLVLVESLRAEEIHSFSTIDHKDTGATPNLDLLVKNGLSFQQVIHTGVGTRYGQVANLCSAIELFNYPIMVLTPMVRMNCLPDIMASKGYETFFFYGAENHFDNQETFYSFHHTKTVISEQNFANREARGFWGYSDRVLFDKVVEVLRVSKSPFFSVVLTLSNHHPYLLPDDIYKDIDKNLPLADQLLRYDDRAIGDFIKNLAISLPHTILILTADHGTSRLEEIDKTDFSFATIRKTSRVPLIFYIPDLPQDLRGTKIDHLASNADLPPTLLSLLGWTDLEQQFLGMDIFSRTNQPIFVNWFETLLKISQKNSSDNLNIKIEKATNKELELFTVLPAYNLFMPE